MMSNAELIAVQRLHIRLLYDQALVREYAADTEGVLARHNLPARWRSVLPDPKSENHEAEMYGRRVQAAQELLNVFSASLAHLVGEPPATDRQIIGAAWFGEFLGSDVFFEPGWSLPHPAGYGRAYDGYSRFFFWARDAFGMRAPGAPMLLRDDLYLDMAANLDNQKIGATDPGWARLSNGFFWLIEPGTGGPCRGLDKNRVVFHREGERAREALAAEGLCDLDELMP